MEAVDKVGQEVDKVITKFTAISEHASKLLSAEQASLELLKATLLERKSPYHWLDDVDVQKFASSRIARQPIDPAAGHND